MESYHLRTREPDKYDAMGFEFNTVDSIFVPERRVLVGFLKWDDFRGLVLNYGASYCSRAQDIVDGNKNGVRGEVISQIDLNPESIDKIMRNPNEFRLNLTRKFDSQTSTLVDILTGEYVTCMTRFRKKLTSPSYY